tara:strand:- start:1316 stop:2035 length:720 start_codon:yes stop_codon:yes gene_type:complete
LAINQVIEVKLGKTLCKSTISVIDYMKSQKNREKIGIPNVFHEFYQKLLLEYLSSVEYSSHCCDVDAMDMSSLLGYSYFTDINHIMRRYCALGRVILRNSSLSCSHWRKITTTNDCYNKAIRLEEKFSKFTEHWSPRVVAKLNDYELKVVKVQGDFVWHKHSDTDEVFIVIDGEMRIDMQDSPDVILKAGELCVVKKGDVHKPYAEHECKILLIEPADVINTGDGNENSTLTAKNDQWV